MADWWTGLTWDLPINKMKAEKDDGAVQTQKVMLRWVQVQQPHIDLSKLPNQQKQSWCMLCCELSKVYKVVWLVTMHNTHIQTDANVKPVSCRHFKNGFSSLFCTTLLCWPKCLHCRSRSGLIMMMMNWYYSWECVWPTELIFLLKALQGHMHVQVPCYLFCSSYPGRSSWWTCHQFPGRRRGCHAPMLPHSPPLQKVRMEKWP